MQAGKLRSRLTIQSPSLIRNGRGEEIETWTDMAANVQADVRQLAGKELLTAQQVNSEATWRIVMRYRPGVTALCRLLYDGHVLDIIAVADVEQRHRSLLIDAKEHPSA